MSWSTQPAKRSYLCRGDFLKLLREQRGWTQEELATRAGYSPRLVRKAESMSSLSPETVADLAEALSIAGSQVYPEDLVSNPLGDVKLLFECYDQYEREMLKYCQHLFSEEFVLWVAGDEQEMPIAGTYHGIPGMQGFLDRFFTVFTRPKKLPFEPMFSGAGNEILARYIDYTEMNGLEAPAVWIVNVIKFERGKVIRMEIYFDTNTGQKFIDDASQSDRIGEDQN